MLFQIPYSRGCTPFAAFALWRKSQPRRLSHYPQPFIVAILFLAFSICSYLCIASPPAVSNNVIASDPIALNDEYTGIEDTPMTLVGITSNDIDDDGFIDHTTIDLDPNQPGQQTSIINAHGTYALTIASGEITFVPALDWSGITSITYTVNDNEGNTSNVAYLYITISSVIDAPIAMDDYASGLEDDAFIQVSAVHINDIDPEGQGFIIGSIDIDPTTLTQDLYFEDATGAWMADPGLGTIRFFPNSDFHGTAMIGYTLVSFTNMLSNVALVYVDVAPTNDAPLAAPNSIVVNTGTSALLPQITANDSDLENNIQINTVDLNPSTAGVQTSLSNAQGNWSVDALSGDVTFLANAGFSGAASIMYVVSDSLGLVSNPAALTAHMIGTNASPIAMSDGATGLEDSPHIHVPNITANDTDPDGDEQILVNTIDIDPIAPGQQIALSNATGLWTADTLTGTLTYVPVLNFNGNADIWYSIKDVGGMESAPAHVVVTVTPDDDNPIASADSAQTSLNTVCFINDILDNDFDLESALDPSSVDLNLEAMGIQHTFTNDAGQWDYIVADEKVQYTPTVGFLGTAVHEYVVRDVSGTRSLPASLVVDVLAAIPNPVGPVPSHLNHAVIGAANDSSADAGKWTSPLEEDKSLVQQPNTAILQRTAYYDSNMNCMRDADEIPLTGMQIALNDDQYRIQPNVNGHYALPLTVTEYSMVGINSTYWQNTCTPAQHHDAQDDAPYSVDIPYTPVVYGYDLAVHLVGLAWEANSTRQTTLTYQNSGTVDAEQTQLTLNYPEGVSIIDASIPWTYFDGQNYVWELGAVPLGSAQSITLIDAIHHTPKAGDILRVNASIRATGEDLAGENNTCQLDREIQAHVVSNTMQVSPKGAGDAGSIENHQELLYTIQFQNNGGHMARNLRIENTLPPNLDMNTFAIVAASDDYSLVITDDRHVTISFANIDLPSSALSQLESQGVISYSIRPLAGASAGETIENKATLYFDDEDPIATNEVINTLRDQWEDSAVQMTLWPNPTSGILHIGLHPIQNTFDDRPTLQRVEITDSKGQLVKGWNTIAAHQLDFNTSELPAGGYQVRVIDQAGRVQASRFIVMKEVD